MIDRPDCPVCGSHDRKYLFPVSPEIFIRDNTTIDPVALRESGLLSLTDLSLVRCDQCELVYTDRLISEKWANVFWDKVYVEGKSKEKINKASKKLLNMEKWSAMYSFLLANCLRDGETVNVLDFGCGWSDFASMADSLGVRVIGIEKNKEKISYARERNYEVYSSLDEIKENIKFKIFHIDQVVEHLPGPVETIEHVLPWLHPEFVGYIGVPNYSKKRISGIIDDIKYGRKVSDKDLITWDHVNYFDSSSLGYFLNKIGMSPVDLSNGLLLSPLEGTNTYFRFSNVSSVERSNSGPIGSVGIRILNRVKNLFHSI